MIHLSPGFIREKRNNPPEKQIEILSDVDYYSKVITDQYVPITSEMPITSLHSDINKYDTYMIWEIPKQESGLPHTHKHIADLASYVICVNPSICGL